MFEPKKVEVDTKRELTILHRVGFCKNCFRGRRDGSAYCGECQNEPPRMKIYQDNQNKFPLLVEVMDHFKLELKDLKHIVFTYGDTIYSNEDLSYGLIAHEITHVFQQMKMGKEAWWKEYLKDDTFRLNNELEAYRQQYRVYKENSTETAELAVSRMAGDLSGKMYGGIIEFEAAKDSIKVGL